MARPSPVDDDLPLAGVQVLEIAHYIAGPYSAQILGDQGASVVKVEPPIGDPGHRALPLAPSGESLYYAAYNRNKRNVCLDLRSPDARPALDALLRWADVVITNYSVGVPERLGFGWERLHEVNPAASLIFISGFGSYSALRDYVAFDAIVTAMSGVVDLTGDPTGPPAPSAVLLADHSTAVQAAFAATTALQRRHRTGEGSYVEVSMLRSLGALLGDHLPAESVLGARPTRLGNRSDKRYSGLYPTADGHVVIAPLTFPMWQAFCTAIGRPEWAREEVVRDRTHVRGAFRAEIDEVATAWLTARTSAEVMVEFQSLGIPAGAVRSVHEVVRDDGPIGTRMFETVELADGSRATVSGRVFDWTDGGPPPTHHNRITEQGADGADVLREAGLDDAGIDALVRAGVLVGSRTHG